MRRLRSNCHPVLLACIVSLWLLLPTCKSSESPIKGTGGSAVGIPPASASAEPTGPVVIGLITEMTGALAETGKAQVAAIKMAVEEWNVKGGVKGRPIELVIEDDASNPAGAVNAFNRLISINKPAAVIGPAYASFLIAIDPSLKQASIPLVTAASGEKVTAIGNPWFFRVGTNEVVVSRLTAQIAVKELGYKKIGIIYVAGEFGRSGARVVRESLEKLGLAAVQIEDYNIDDKDVTDQLLNLQKAGVELIVGRSYSPDAAMVMTNLDKLGYKMKLLGSPGYGAPEALNRSGPSANGVYVVTDWLPSDDHVVQAWVEKIESRQKSEAVFANAAYYDGANILFRAIEKAGTDPQEIRKAMLATQGYKGIVGEYSFDENGDSLRQVYLAEIRNEKLVLLKVVTDQ